MVARLVLATGPTHLPLKRQSTAQFRRLCPFSRPQYPEKSSSPSGRIRDQNAAKLGACHPALAPDQKHVHSFDDDLNLVALLEPQFVQRLDRHDRSHAGPRRDFEFDQTHELPFLNLSHFAYNAIPRSDLHVSSSEKPGLAPAKFEV